MAQLIDVLKGIGSKDEKETVWREEVDPETGLELHVEYVDGKKHREIIVSYNM